VIPTPSPKSEKFDYQKTGSVHAFALSPMSGSQKSAVALVALSIAKKGKAMKSLHPPGPHLTHT